jgi:CubicO group peptidase (beta-lactamase class C family)
MKSLCTLFLCYISGLSQAQIEGVLIEKWTPHTYALPINCDSEKVVPGAIEDITAVLRDSGTLAATVAVSYDGRLLMSCGVGYDDSDARPRLAADPAQFISQVKPDTLFRIASLTKPVTAAMVMHAVADGKLRLTDLLLPASGITPYNGVVQDWHATCTIDKALKHQCGIRNALSPDGNILQNTTFTKPFTMVQQLSYDVSLPSQIPDPQYSNVAYALLGIAVERATGVAYEEYMHLKIFAPLGVNRAEVVVGLGALNLKNATGEVVDGREVGEVWYDSSATRFSEYDGTPAVKASDSFRLENSGGAFSLVATSSAMSRFASNYCGNGLSLAQQPTGCWIEQSGVLTGTSAEMYSDVTASGHRFAFVFIGNRYATDGKGYSVSANVFLKLRARLLTQDLSSLTHNLWDKSLSPSITVKEYYAPSLDHYFITGSVDEQKALDPGTAGWLPTGNSFQVWALGTTGTNPLVRFYNPGCGGTLLNRNSHFYSASYAEASFLNWLNPKKLTNAVSDACAKGNGWRYEEKIAGVRPVTNGVCSAGSVPLYRAYNNGHTHTSRNGDPNHRYTTKPAVINEMLAKGWVSEGAVMCVRG